MDDFGYTRNPLGKHPVHQWGAAFDHQFKALELLDIYYRFTWDALSALPEGRRKATALARLEESHMWASKAISFEEAGDAETVLPTPPLSLGDVVETLQWASDYCDLIVAQGREGFCICEDHATRALANAYRVDKAAVRERFIRARQFGHAERTVPASEEKVRIEEPA